MCVTATLLASPAGPRPAEPPPLAPTPVSGRDALLTLPAEPALVGCARHFAENVLIHWKVPSDACDAAVLVVGELAANAARHGRSRMTVRLTLTPDALRLVVSDHGLLPRPRRPHLVPVSDPDEHGRGIALVETLASRVETRRHDNGHWVRATLPVAPARLMAA
ncbi:ATP-binding protein [Streptomyces sp. NEAU-Y11]|uniref:ATP-binding protein n=1 Tax=Streptomyces cucumeris TaxID=2962890 RepID=UPI0020C89B7E|nr:ATP-binding protein [Streptomyces sp. NEAU-Y11]MCP9212310.1 ATP-binding protein [Streptomyces sp. NEAU-Y11]